jgi:hypothetical protein
MRATVVLPPIVGSQTHAADKQFHKLFYHNFLTGFLAFSLTSGILNSVTKDLIETYEMSNDSRQQTVKVVQYKMRGSGYVGH